MKEMKLSKEELKWRVKDDVETIKRYNEIVNDKERYKLAIDEIKKQSENLLSLIKKNKKGE
nr:MAG TPA: hypothetical protein [Caudoviricetes sp.]